MWDISLFFWFDFFWWLKMARVFSCACWSSVYLLWGKKSFQNFGLYFNQVIYFIFIFIYFSSLHILNINPLSDISISNLVCHSVGGLFIFLRVSLILQKLFSLMWSPLFTFAFASAAWGCTQNKYTKTKEFTDFVYFWRFYGFKSYF